jgi:hypothetical protein
MMTDDLWGTIRVFLWVPSDAAYPWIKMLIAARISISIAAPFAKAASGLV